MLSMFETNAPKNKQAAVSEFIHLKYVFDTRIHIFIRPDIRIVYLYMQRRNRIVSLDRKRWSRTDSSIERRRNELWPLREIWYGWCWFEIGMERANNYNQFGEAYKDYKIANISHLYSKIELKFFLSRQEMGWKQQKNGLVQCNISSISTIYTLDAISGMRRSLHITFHNL